MTRPESDLAAAVRAGNYADELVARLNEWFPEWTWEARTVGSYCCVWASTTERGTFDGLPVTLESTERVARCVNWVNARDSARIWAWKQRKLSALRPASTGAGEREGGE